MDIKNTLSQNNTNNPHLLGSGDIRQLLGQYSFPAIIGMVVTSLYHIIDSIFIGQGIGAMALSGMAVTFPLMNILMAFSTLIGVGGATLTSIRLGQKDEHGAVSILAHVTIINALNAVILGGTTFIFLEPILRLFGASEALLPYAYDFMWVYLLGTPIGFVFFSLNNMMRVSGYPKKAMLSSFLTVAVNIILAPLFIFVFGWGMKGTALATVLSQFTGLIWVGIHFLNKNNYIHFEKGIYRLSLKTIGSMMAIGISPFLMHLTSSLVVSVINGSLIKYGGDLAVGAYGIINRVATLFVMIVIGLTMGMQPIVGYNYGARQLDRSFKALKYTLIGAMTITTTGFLLGELFPGWIVKLFTNDLEMMRISERGLRITMAAFPIVGPQIVISNFFQSIGKAKISVFLSLTRQLIFLVPALLVLPLFYALDGVFVSMPVADSIAFVVTILTFLYQLRKIKRMAALSPMEKTVSATSL
ncbi:MAG TPA: MATE family efflux transporter [Porphyromonadaceae bacterium]|jgi:putative MATE family efflux protein|nr:MATE family efflux transporter [Porphyromonadaceae bacterium]HBL33523.1 MATE family efflux transporter [Porphyromonadaceae bacterium]HBX18999.1 MATE family efflux transporter [Porphyromonadaceae bacterium]HCM20560.1 MATE family efflux transporter [Porphyromonadaceae bacterium]